MGPDQPLPGYALDPALALSARSSWERQFHAELTRQFAHATDEAPMSLTAAVLPERLVQRVTEALSSVATLPSWAAQFIRRRQIPEVMRDADTAARTAPLVTAQDVADALAPTLATAAYANHVLTLLASRGIDYKQWVTRHDDKVRHTHRAADGQWVRLSAPFVVGGSLMQHPADSRTAPIGEWINDRCVIIGHVGH